MRIAIIGLGFLCTICQMVKGYKGETLKEAMYFIVANMFYCTSFIVGSL